MSASWDKSSEKALVTEEIKELIQYFNNVINLIPPKIYFNKNEEILETIEAQKRKKFQDSQSLSAKSKNKRIKLDPNCHQTVSDVAQEYCQQKKNSVTKSDLRKKLAKRIKELRRNRMPNKDMQCSPQSNSKDDDGDDDDDEKEPKQNSTPKIFNKKGDLVFSKFDLLNQVDLQAEQEMAKKKMAKKNPSLKGLLAKSQRDEDRINKLKVQDPDAAIRLKEKKLWSSVLERSEGNKVRDDPKLLTKTINQKKKFKQKHREKWAARKEMITKQREIRQQKRQKNIQDRKQKRKDKKLKRYQKKRTHLVETKN